MIKDEMEGLSDWQRMELYIRETFYTFPDREFTMPELQKIVGADNIGDIYDILRNLERRNFITASWDTSKYPRKRIFKFKE